ncbi:MAG: nucleotidyltransferase [Candidatus Hydrogenedentota bacterium]|nr:MAG: nucleotidyltransferase [Candidatus Hydrogenedentota bacterium]
MLQKSKIQFPTPDELAAFRRRNHIAKLSLFGSVLRDDFDDQSDIDVLVEFEPNVVIGLRLIRIQNELSTLFGGRKIDLVTPKFLHRRIRKKVLSTAKVQYAA